jgi:hypothetical protein
MYTLARQSSVTDPCVETIMVKALICVTQTGNCMQPTYQAKHRHADEQDLLKLFREKIV